MTVVPGQDDGFDVDIVVPANDTTLSVDLLTRLPAVIDLTLSDTAPLNLVLGGEGPAGPAGGPTGPTGPTGPAGVGPTGPTGPAGTGGGGGGAYRGAFNPSTDYSTGDIVEHLGCTWIATSNTTGTPALPTGVFSDNFNRPDSGTVGWTLEDAMFSVAGNKMVGTPDGGVKQLLQAVGSINGTLTMTGVVVDLPRNWCEMGVYFRYSDANNYLILRYQEASTVGLYKKVGGTETLIGNLGAVSDSAVDVSVTFVGTDISGSWGGVAFSFSAANGVPTPGGGATTIGWRHALFTGARGMSFDNVVFTPAQATGWSVIERPYAMPTHTHYTSDITDFTSAVEAIVGPGSGSGGGLFRGSWSSLEVVTAVTVTDAASLVPLGASLSGTTAFVSTPSGVNQPAQGTVLVLGPGALGYMNITIPAGVTRVRWYAKVDDGFYDVGQEIRVNGAVAAGWQAADWAYYEWNVAAGNNFQWNNQASFLQWGTWHISTIELLGARGTPYMLGEYVTYNGRLWKSLSDNNPGTPGTSGWIEVQWVIDIADVVGLQAALDAKTTPRVPYVFSDVRSTLTVGPGTSKVPNVTGRTLTLVAVRVDVGTAPTGASLIVDVNKNGSTIFTTQASRPTVGASALFASSGAIDVTSWASNETLTVDIDQVGSGVAGGLMTVTIIAEG